MLENTKISVKIFGLVALLLVMMAVSSSTGIYQMMKIGVEIEDVAEVDIPLTEKLTKVTIHQLEQAILLERAFFIGEELKTNPDELKHFHEVEKKFAKLGHKVEEELHEVEEMLAHEIEVAHTEEMKKEFEHLLSVLTKVDAEHKDYEKLSEKTLKQIGAGELEHPAEIATKIEKEQDQIVHELEEALLEIEHFTAEAMLTAEDHEKFAIVLLSVISGVSLLLGMVFAFFLVRSIVKPVNGMTGSMGELAEGNLEIDIPAQNLTNEIGQMAQAVQVFKDNAIRVKQMEAEQVEAEKRAEEEKSKLMNQMADDFQNSVGGVIQSVSSASTQLQSSAQSMSTISEQTSSQATSVAAASEEASTNVQTVASAADQLSSSISEISRQVNQSTKIAGTAVEAAGKADEMVQGLAMSAQKINEVVQIITDIADQTNLLALNATIEAARAGEAGKGFAVVASEVKNLANQTAKATEEIGGQISGIQGATEDSVKAIQDITKTISEINEISTTISAAVEEQGAATSEIARNVEQAAAGTGEVSSNISGVTQAAGEAGESASEVLTAANDLSNQSEVLKNEVDKFMSQVRAA